jgi:small-conductance mechanosensitive channel
MEHWLQTLDLRALDFTLLTLGKAEITVGSLLKLVAMTLLLVLVAGRMSRWTLAKLLARTDMAPGQRSAVTALVHYVVLVVGTIVILQNAGINLTAFAVVASALGVGVGFGLQNVISNFISGLIILIEQPIRVGDRIELAGVEGVVQEIGARRTTVVTNDRIAILVPNQRFITDNVTNYVHLGGAIRIKVPVQVAGDADLGLVRELLLEAARSLPEVARDPPPAVALISMTGGNLALELQAWYDGNRLSRHELQSALNLAMQARLAGRGVKVT